MSAASRTEGLRKARVRGDRSAGARAGPGRGQEAAWRAQSRLFSGLTGARTKGHVVRRPLGADVGKPELAG